MKKLLLAVSLGLVSVTAFGQATFNGKNTSTTPVLAEGGLLSQIKESKLTGRAELFFGGTLLNTAKNTFGVDGIFSFGVLTVAGKADKDVVSITLKTWDTAAGATYADAVAAGHGFATATFDVALAAGLSTPGAMPNFTGAILASPTNVPEPSTIALGVLGLGGLFFVSRRK